MSLLSSQDILVWNPVDILLQIFIKPPWKVITKKFRNEITYYVIFTVLATGSHRMRSEFEDLLVQHTRSENIGSGETWKSPNTVGRSFRALNSCTGSGAWVWRFLLKSAVVHHGFSSWAIRPPSRTIDKERAQVHQQRSRLRLRGDLTRAILACSRHVCGGG